MSKRNIIRKNDRVRIVNPEVVIRWGYPLSKKIVIDTFITPEQKEAVCALLRAFGVPPPATPATPTDTIEDMLNVNWDHTTYDKVMDIMAYVILVREKFGGRERKVYSERKESLLNATGYVVEKKVVMSGTYKSGGGYVGGYFSDEYDYTPPYLSVAKAHVLCRVYVDWREGICANINAENGGVWIENINLQKIENNVVEPPRAGINIEALRERLAEFERR
jgi:hypothetical protein